VELDFMEHQVQMEVEVAVAVAAVVERLQVA
jgi:hypothetical protein